MGLNDGNACCSSQLCGNGEGDRSPPSWSVKGPLWSYLERLLRFHCWTPLRQQQLSCSPALAPTRGELRPQTEAWQKTFFTRLIFGGDFVEIFVSTSKVNYHLLWFEPENELHRLKGLFPVCLLTERLTGSEWLIGSAGFNGCHFTVYSSCCLSPDGHWSSRFGRCDCFYLCGFP